MEIVNVLVAAVAGYAFGAAWYMVLSKPWMAAAGIKAGPDGRPEGQSNPTPFILAAVAMVLVAGMMRHIFSMADIDTVIKGIMAGGGIGLFMISPWIMINNGYGGRPFLLTLIDGGYATFGCALMGIVLVVF